MERKSRFPAWIVVCLMVCLIALFVFASNNWSPKHLSFDQIQLHISNLFGNHASETARWSPKVDRTKIKGQINNADGANFEADASDNSSLRETGSKFSALTDTANEPIAEVMDPPVADQISIIQPQATENRETIAARPTMPRDVIPLQERPKVAPRSLADEHDAPGRDLPPESPIVVSPWAVPRQLIGSLEKIKELPIGQHFALQALDLINQLTSCQSLIDAQVGPALDQLSQSLSQIEDLLQRAPSIKIRSKLLRVKYALMRRIEIWKLVYAIESRDYEYSLVARSTPQDLLKTLHLALENTTKLENYREWSHYLLISTMRDAFGEDRTIERRQTLAAELLRRLDSPTLTSQQRSYFRSEEFNHLRLELRRWAAKSVDFPTFLASVEEYESEPNPKLAGLIARDAEHLSWSNDKLSQRLGIQVDTHYRNANFRVAASGKLLNRFLPEQQSFTERVNEKISGADVRGISQTTNRLALRLMPDRHRIRLGLEAHGNILSDTGAYSGPVVFWNEGRARYQARKVIMIDRLGVKVRRAEAEANSETYVKGLKTDYDGLFILEDIVRSIAKSEHQEKARSVKYEVERKVANKAKSRFDEEVHAKLAKAEVDFKQHIIEPLQRLQLDPVAIGMETTEQRVIARCRLAGHSQLGAHTPRPQAKSDSYLSIQFHQSGFNNLVQKLQFDGQTFDLQDLVEQLVQVFEFNDGVMPDDIPEGVIIRFADSDAVRFDFDDSRVAITVRFQSLAAGKHFHWRNFTVRAHYVPQVDGLNVRLVRDPNGYIALEGKRLRLRDQVALRGIFSKVFTASRTYSVIPERITKHPKLRDLNVTQFVIEEGWVGVALAPRSRFVKRPGQE